MAKAMEYIKHFMGILCNYYYTSCAAYGTRMIISSLLHLVLNFSYEYDLPIFIPVIILNPNNLFTKIPVVQKEVAFSYHGVRGLHFLAVIFAAAIIITGRISLAY